MTPETYEQEIREQGDLVRYLLQYHHGHASWTQIYQDIEELTGKKAHAINWTALETHKYIVPDPANPRAVQLPKK